MPNLHYKVDLIIRSCWLDWHLLALSSSTTTWPLYHLVYIEIFYFYYSINKKHLRPSIDIKSLTIIVCTLRNTHFLQSYKITSYQTLFTLYCPREQIINNIIVLEVHLHTRKYINIQFCSCILYSFH